MKGLISTIIGLSFALVTEQQVIQGDYYGSWYDTNWSYHFQNDGTFKFSSKGHFGNTFSLGKYTINKDTLILNSCITDSVVKNKSFLPFTNSKYLIDGDSCIISLSIGYNYCKNYRVEVKDSKSNEIWMNYKASKKKLSGEK